MANEKRLIDANALEKHIGDCYGYPAVDILHEIATFPTVDAVEVVHGRWEYHDPVSPNCFCSVCHYDAPWDDFGDYHAVRTNYCPNCGADMRDGDGNVV